MSSVIRAATVYLFLLIIFRIAGKRSIAQITTFDLILSLIISEAVQQALIDSDNSMTNAFVIVSTLVGMNVLFSVIKQRSALFDKLIDGRPVIVMQDGQLLRDAMDLERVDEEDILGAAREQEGVETLAKLKYAVVERDGSISVVPK